MNGHSIQTGPLRPMMLYAFSTYPAASVSSAAPTSGHASVGLNATCISTISCATLHPSRATISTCELHASTWQVRALLLGSLLWRENGGLLGSRRHQAYSVLRACNSSTLRIPRTTYHILSTEYHTTIRIPSICTRTCVPSRAGLELVRL